MNILKNSLICLILLGCVTKTTFTMWGGPEYFEKQRLLNETRQIAKIAETADITQLKKVLRESGLFYNPIVRWQYSYLVFDAAKRSKDEAKIKLISDWKEGKLELKDIGEADNK